MAKKPSSPGPAGHAPRPDSSIPAPPAELRQLARLVTWNAGRIIHRVHPEDYLAVQFNPGPHGNARFSPIRSEMQKSIPTIYGGDTFECAAMETAFHDVPFAAGLKTLDRNKLSRLVHSQVRPIRDLNLVDLGATALRNLGIRRNELIDTEKDRYPETRAWAEAMHAAIPEADGLSWVSRQDDSARAILLFGDRIEHGMLDVAAPSRSILNDDPPYGDLLALGIKIGVTLIDGST